MKDLLNVYFKEAGKYEVLTKEQTLKLAFAAKQGDKKARNALINSNLRFVVKLAKDYKNKYHFASIDDLIAAGNIGLIKAADKFEPDYNNSFTTYAQFWIRDEINKELNLSHDIILPRSLANDKEMTSMTIAESIDDENFNEGSVSEQYITNTEEAVEKEMTVEYVRNALSTLSDTDQTILRLHYGIGCQKKTLQQIGLLLGGYTKERVRQLEEKAILKLRTRNAGKILEGLCA